jgi:hypothetical protein
LKGGSQNRIVHNTDKIKRQQQKSWNNCNGPVLVVVIMRYIWRNGRLNQVLQWAKPPIWLLRNAKLDQSEWHLWRYRHTRVKIYFGLICSEAEIYKCKNKLPNTKVRRVWRYQRDTGDNTMAKRKCTKGQTTIYKTYT